MFIELFLSILEAIAVHPSGWQTTPAIRNFTLATAPRQSVTSTHDAMGNLATRTWSGGKSQTLTWDARGRLVKVIEAGSARPFTWTALYNGLDRRVRTTYTPHGGAAVTIDSIFDPEVEFLELGIGIGTQWTWKLYGPDLSGTYGGLQGLGGLEAVVAPDGTTRGIINDWWGNAVGWVETAGGPMTWSPAQFLAWGPAPGWSTAPQEGTQPLHKLLGYRGLTVDPPGFVQQGLRAYDPALGRWLSPDPLGHAGSLSLYDYCDNDPVNLFDPDGRFGKRAWDQGWRGDFATADNGMAGVLGQTGAGLVPIAGQVADFRDSVAAVKSLWNNPTSGAEWGNLGLTAVAWFPGLGDAIKGSSRVVRQLDNVPTSSLPSPHGGGGGGPSWSGGGGSTGAGGGPPAAKTPPNRIYSARELIRRTDEPGPMHNFPESFNTEIFAGTRTVVSSNYVLYTKPGTIHVPGQPIYGQGSVQIGGERVPPIIGYTPSRTVDGVYEIGVRPSASGRTEVITHRFFRPNE